MQKNGTDYEADVGYERFLGPEMFFSPEIVSSDFLTPLPQVVDEAILKCPIDSRRGLFKVGSRGALTTSCGCLFSALWRCGCKRRRHCCRKFEISVRAASMPQRTCAELLLSERHDLAIVCKANMWKAQIGLVLAAVVYRTVIGALLCFPLLDVWLCYCHC